MSIQEEIIASLRTVVNQAEPVVDPRASQVWQTSLQRALGGPVEEVTRYPSARAYRFDRAVAGDGNDRWRTELRIRISGVGPYATHSFIHYSNLDHWWAGAIRASRTGFLPEHAEVLQRLQVWYHENGIAELDHQVLAEPAPEGTALLKRSGSTATTYAALFAE